MEARARCKAALSSAHHLRRQPASAARRTAGGARSARRRTKRLSRTPRGPTARPFHKQKRPAAAGQAGEAPNTAPPCGPALPQWLRRPPRPRVAAVGRRDGAEQRAWRRSTALRPSAWRRKEQDPVLRTDAWRRSVGQPLLRDNPTAAVHCATQRQEQERYSAADLVQSRGDQM